MRKFDAPENITNCAEQVIYLAGGAEVVKGVLGKKSKQSIYYYTWPKPKGTGGVIPADGQMKLLAWAGETGKDLQHSDFFVLRDEFTTEAA
jgi:hypothetical protein